MKIHLRQKNIFLPTIMVALLVLAMAIPAHCADSFVDRVARITSDSITPYLLVSGLTLLSDHAVTKQEDLQTCKALALTCVATEFLKVTVREKRPNSDSRTSFPSGHTSAAFAMATCLADYKPKLAIPAYAAATAIGWSRVEVHAHRWHDVAAGAALGYFVGKHFTGEHLSVSPSGLDLNWKF